MSSNDYTRLELVGCPQCAAPAEVVDRFDLPGTGGPVEHVKVQCVDRHWFTMAASHLHPRPASAPARALIGEEPVR